MCSARTQAVRNGGTKTKKRRIEEDGETDDGIDAVEEPSYIVSIERDLRMDQQEWKATYFRDPPLEQVEKIPEFVSASKRSDAHGCIKVLRVAFEHYKEAGAYSSVVDQLQRDMHWVQRVEAQLGRSLGVRYHPTHLFVGQWSYDLDQVVSRLEGACEQDGVDLDYMRNDVVVVGGRRAFTSAIGSESNRRSRRHDGSSNRHETSGRGSDPGTNNDKQSGVLPPRGGHPVGIPAEGAGFESTTCERQSPP